MQCRVADISAVGQWLYSLHMDAGDGTCLRNPLLLWEGGNQATPGAISRMMAKTPRMAHLATYLGRENVV